MKKKSKKEPINYNQEKEAISIVNMYNYKKIGPTITKSVFDRYKLFQ